MSTQSNSNNSNNNNNNSIDNSNVRELPTSNHPGILFPNPLTTDELGSGWGSTTTMNPVETTTVVTRELEVVPQESGSYLDQEAVMESKSTSSNLK